MLQDAVLIGFVATTDLARAKTFYHGTLGLDLIAETPHVLVLDAGGTMLRVTAVPELTPQPHTILGWQVSDIDMAVTELTAKGVIFERYDLIDQDGPPIWRSPNDARVAWFNDPDSNTLSLTQFSG